MDTNKAIAYARVSTKDQSDRGYSLPTQLAEIAAYAGRSGLSLVEVFQEDASGLQLDRAQLNRARDYLRRGLASALICHEDDRLTRVPEHSVVLRAEFEAAGVSLHYARRGQIKLDDVGYQIGEDIRARIASQEIKKLVERSRRGKRGKVATGKVIVAQRPPYGYRLVDGALIIDEAEAEVIRLIFRLYTLEKKSIKEITKYLTEQKTPTAADKSGWYKKREPGVWATSVIRRILGNETYTGLWHWGKTRRQRVNSGGKRIMRYTPAPRADWLAVAVPAIINRATFDAAQKLLVENKKNASRNTKNKYLMAKRLTCGCGCSIYAETRRDPRYGYNFMYYSCASKSHHHLTPNCGAPYFRAADIDETVWQWIKKLLKNPDMMLDLLNKNIEETTASQSGAVAELEKTEADLKRQQIGLEKLYEQLAASEIEQKALDRARAGIGSRINELLTKKAELQAALIETPPPDAAAELFKAIHQYQSVLSLDNEPFPIRRNWVEALNLRGTLTHHDKQKFITISCYLGQFLLSIGTPLPTNNDYKLEIRQTIELPNHSLQVAERML